jgi:hypothetical protein
MYEEWKFILRMICVFDFLFEQVNFLFTPLPYLIQFENKTMCLEFYEWTSFSSKQKWLGLKCIGFDHHPDLSNSSQFENRLISIEIPKSADFL